MTVTKEDLLEAIDTRASRPDETRRAEAHRELEDWFNIHIGVGTLGEFDHAIRFEGPDDSYIELPDDCSALVEGLPLDPRQGLEVRREPVTVAGCTMYACSATLWTSEDDSPYLECQAATGTPINDIGDLAEHLDEII